MLSIVPKVLSILTLVFVFLTVGCGLAIHFGGEEFKNAIKGHVILAIMAL